MPPSYTISPSDVSSVNPASSLTAGVEFDYGTQRINVPSSVSVVNAQWIADHCAFVQATILGVARKPICEAFGKYKKGVDPGSGLDVLAGIDAILLDGWLINSQKTTGAFKVIDVYKTDGSFPIVNNPSIQIQYETALRSGLILGSGSGGGGIVTGLTPDALDDIAAAVESQLADDFASVTATVDLTPVLNAIDTLPTASEIDTQLADNFTAVLNAIAAKPNPDNTSIAAILAKVNTIVVTGGKVEAMIGSTPVELSPELTDAIRALLALSGYRIGTPATNSATGIQAGTYQVQFNTTDPNTTIVTRIS